MTDLTCQFTKLHNHHGRSAIDWFDWFLDDCLAPFGRPIQSPPPKDCIADLFELGQLYANSVRAHEPFTDLMSQTYQELASVYGKKSLGQYFTPVPVCRMIARMTIGDTLASDRPIHRLLEPCIGSGSMVLAFLQEWLEINGSVEKVSVTGIDLDRFCSRMASLQLLGNWLIHDLPIGEVFIYRGNALGDPANFERICGATFAGLSPVDIVPEPARIRELGTVQKMRIDPKEQLALF